MRKKDIVHFLGTENLPHFIHSCSFLLVLSSSLSSSMKHCNTHKCTLFVHNLRATYQGTYILIFVQFPRYRLFLYPFGWRLSGKKKISTGSTKPNSLFCLTKSYIFGQPHSTLPYTILVFKYTAGFCISYSPCLESSSLRKLLLLVIQALAYFIGRGRKTFPYYQTLSHQNTQCYLNIYYYFLVSL